MLAPTRTHSGPELELHVRQMAIGSLRADSRDLKLAVDAVGQGIKAMKANTTELVRNPLDVAAQKLLIPAALSLSRGLRARKEPGKNMREERRK